MSAQPTHRHAPALLASLLAVAWFVETRDPYTGGHLWRVSRLARALATAAGWPPHDVARVAVGAFLHDVGKIGVPDAILRKPAALSSDERAVLATHPQLGLRMLAAHPLAHYVRAAVGSHHEQPDGAGYPMGLTAAAIPRDAAVVALADAFDAMTSARPYRRGLPRDAALARVRDALGTQFDAPLGVLFVDMGDRGAFDGIVGHSDDGIPLHHCPMCGPIVAVPRGTPDGELQHCPNCAREFRVSVASNGATHATITATGRLGDAAAMIPSLDEQLIARIVEESVAALIVA